MLGHEKYYRRALSVGGFDLSKYSEADVKSLVACVKSAAVRLRKLNSDFQKPEVLRKPNNYRIKLVDVSKVLKTNLTKLNEKWQKIILEGGSELDDLEQQIETTDLMQLKIGGNFERLFDYPKDAKKLKVSLLAFFRKFKKDLSGVLHSKLLMSIIYNHGHVCWFITTGRGQASKQDLYSVANFGVELGPRRPRFRTTST